MNLSKPPLPVTYQIRKNNHVQQTVQRKSRQKLIKSAAKNGVSLARDHSIKFDKKYQEKHLISKSGIRLDTSKRTINSTELQATNSHNQSFRVFNSKSYTTLDDTLASNSRPLTNNNLQSGQKQLKQLQKQGQIKSMTSLDFNRSDEKIK